MGEPGLRDAFRCWLLRFACALVIACAACDATAPAGPRTSWPEHAAIVGPAPLRRLSNQEYLNALRDLYPGVSLTLPPLPVDGIVAGFENAAEGQAPSDVRIARYEEIANAYAEALTQDDAALSKLVACKHGTAAEASTCARTFIAREGKRLFRRPLDAQEQDRYALRFTRWQKAVDFAGAVQLTLSAMLQAPQFLYRVESTPSKAEPAPVEPYAMASRLSFLLWESVPDDALYAAAAQGALASEAEVGAEAERMLHDERAKRTFWDFHRQWLNLDRVLSDEHQARTDEVDAHWSVARQQSAELETRNFVEHVATEEGTLRDLLLSRRAFIDAEMAAVYGVKAPTKPWSEVLLPEHERAGLLTRVAFLAGTSHRGATSPPIRGNAVDLGLLCRLPAEPPPGVDRTPPKTQTGDGPKTNRTLFEERTSPKTCYGCHEGLNGIGFGFENYTASGAFTTRDHGLPVDAHGVLLGNDVGGPFNGAIALSELLSRSEVVHHCAVREWLRYALGRAPTREESVLVEELANDFVASGGDLPRLLIAIASAETYRLRRAEAP